MILVLISFAKIQQPHPQAPQAIQLLGLLERAQLPVSLMLRVRMSPETVAKLLMELGQANAQIKMLTTIPNPLAKHKLLALGLQSMATSMSTRPLATQTEASGYTTAASAVQTQAAHPLA